MNKFVKLINELSKTTAGTFIVVAVSMGIFFLLFSYAFHIAQGKEVVSTINYKVVKCDDTHYLYIPNSKDKSPQMFTIENVDSINNIK